MEKQSYKVNDLEPHQLVAAAIGNSELHPELLRLISKQTKAKGKPWDGCFGANPCGCIAWECGWDPNSRVLVSLLLCIGLAHNCWPKVDREYILNAALYATKAEIRKRRLPYTYTNVAISLAAISLYLGTRLGDSELVDFGSTLLNTVTEDRVQRNGFSEFGSPTYLGLSLLSSSFIEQFTGEKHSIVDLLSQDLYMNWSPDIQDFIGTSMRTYGPSIHTHYSLSALALGKYAEPEKVQPWFHREDQSFQRAFELIKPFDISRTRSINSFKNNITDLAKFTRTKNLNNCYIEAVTYEVGTWHHQATSASIHTKNGALILRHPQIETTFQNETLYWRQNGSLEDGKPAWLWGDLKKPMKQHLYNETISTQSWNLSILDYSHIEVGGKVFLVTPKMDTSNPNLLLSAREGFIKLI